MINDPIKYVRDRSTEDADCWLWRQGCTSNDTPNAKAHAARLTAAAKLLRAHGYTVKAPQ